MQWSARVPGPASFEDAAFARICERARGVAGYERLRRAGGRLRCLEPGTQGCVERMFRQMGSGMGDVVFDVVGTSGMREGPERADSRGLESVGRGEEST